MYVTAAGMVCGVGLDAPSSLAAIRANISGFAELAYWDDRGEPIVGVTVPDLDPNLKEDERVLRLLEMSLWDLVPRAGESRFEKIPLLVGLAETDRPGGAAGIADEVVGSIQERTGLRFHPTLSRAFPTGHTAGLKGLRAAREAFRNTGTTACVVCAADSFINASSLMWLDRHWRLKTEENSDGVIPGEAAAAVLLMKESRGMRITGLGFAEEGAHILSEEPMVGLGMAAAVKQAIDEAGLAMHEIDFRTSDVAGEQYAFKEAYLAVARLMRKTRAEMDLWHPAQSVGDVGAAAGLIGLITVRDAFQKGYAPGRNCLLTTSSVPGSRASAVLSAE